jgi:hypothetical protein
MDRSGAIFKRRARRAMAPGHRLFQDTRVLECRTRHILIVLDIVPN